MKTVSIEFQAEVPDDDFKSMIDDGVVPWHVACVLFDIMAERKKGKIHNVRVLGVAEPEGSAE